MGSLVESRELPVVDAGGGISRQVLAGAKLLVAAVTVQAGCTVARHSHPHEQIGYVVSGRAVFTVGDAQREVGPGAMYTIPGGEEHSVTVISDGPAVFVDVFTPVREDYRA